MKYFYLFNKLLGLCFFSVFIFFVFNSEIASAINQDELLLPCSSHSNCIHRQLKVEKANKHFGELVLFASELPRITFVEERSNYWHGIVESQIFKLDDDLEILCISDKKL